MPLEGLRGILQHSLDLPMHSCLSLRLGKRRRAKNGTTELVQGAQGWTPHGYYLPELSATARAAAY